MSVSHEIRFYKKNAQHYIASENSSLINFFDDWTWVLPNFGLPIVPLLLFIENWIWEPALDCIIVCKHPFWMNETGAFVPLRTFFLVFCWESWEFSGQPFGFWFSKPYYGFSTYQLSNLENMKILWQTILYVIPNWGIWNLKWNSNCQP